MNRLSFDGREEPAFGRAAFRHLWPAIDGVPMRGGGVVSALVGTFPAFGVEAARRLLGELPTDLLSGRVPLLVCAACGGYDCGVTSVRVTFDGDLVRWDDFASEVQYGTGPEAVLDDEQTRAQPQLGPYVFEAEAYRDVLRQACAAIADGDGATA